MKIKVAKGGHLVYEGEEYKEGESFEFDAKNEEQLELWYSTGVVERPQEAEVSEKKTTKTKEKK